MKKILFLSAVGALSTAISAPAHATLQVAIDIGGSTFFCGDNMACDTNPATGTIQLGNQTLDGVSVNGSIEFSTGTLANPGMDLISTSSLSIINTSGATVTATVAVSDTSFTGPVHSFDATGSGTWVGAAGSSITYNWYDDPTNTQGASTAFDTPGILLDTFTSNGTNPLHSYSVDKSGLVSDGGPFSMTLQATGTLTPGAVLLDRGQALVKTAIPEPSTWAMMALGFAGLGWVGFARRRKALRYAL